MDTISPRRAPVSNRSRIRAVSRWLAKSRPVHVASRARNVVQVENVGSDRLACAGLVGSVEGVGLVDLFGPPHEERSKVAPTDANGFSRQGANDRLPGVGVEVVHLAAGAGGRECGQVVEPAVDNVRCDCAGVGRQSLVERPVPELFVRLAVDLCGGRRALAASEGPGEVGPVVLERLWQDRESLAHGALCYHFTNPNRGPNSPLSRDFTRGCSSVVRAGDS